MLLGALLQAHGNACLGKKSLQAANPSSLGGNGGQARSNQETHPSVCLSKEKSLKCSLRNPMAFHKKKFVQCWSGVVTASSGDGMDGWMRGQGERCLLPRQQLVRRSRGCSVSAHTWAWGSVSPAPGLVSGTSLTSSASLSCPCSPRAAPIKCRGRGICEQQTLQKPCRAWEPELPETSPGLQGTAR